MNGLKFIRIRCNLSLSELGNVLNVSRQQVSAWENGKKPIPRERLIQLSEYFGIDATYFMEISEKQANDLAAKGLYRRHDTEKEQYSFSAQNYTPAGSDEHPLYYPYSNESMDEKMTSAKKKKQLVLDHVSEVLTYFGTPKKILEEVAAINRGYVIYENLYTYLKNMLKQKPQYRMLYFNILRDVITALLLANELIDESSLDQADYLNLDTISENNDHKAWIQEEALRFRNFYSKKQQAIDEHIANIRKDC